MAHMGSQAGGAGAGAAAAGAAGAAVVAVEVVRKGAELAQRAANSLVGRMEQTAGYGGLDRANPYTHPAGYPRSTPMPRPPHGSRGSDGGRDGDDTYAEPDDWWDDEPTLGRGPDRRRMACRLHLISAVA